MEREENYFVEAEPGILKTSGVQLHYTNSDAPGPAVYMHIHESIELLYIINGNYRAVADRNDYYVGAGDIIMFRSNSLHSMYALDETGGCHFVIKIKPSVLLSMSDRERGDTYVMRFVLHGNDKIVWKADELAGSAIKRYADILKDEFDLPTLGTDVIRKSAACGLLVSILRDDENNGRYAPVGPSNITAAHQIYKAINYINENYRDNISSRECSEKVNMSYSYFSRVFKTITGKTFRTYLTEVRIDHAEKLMIMTDDSITDISAACGFGDVSYFISQYKAHRGTTPHKFRSNAKRS